MTNQEPDERLVPLEKVVEFLESWLEEKNRKLIHYLQMFPQDEFDIALLWSEKDEESTDDPDRLYVTWFDPDMMASWDRKSISLIQTSMGRSLRPKEWEVGKEETQSQVFVSTCFYLDLFNHHLRSIARHGEGGSKEDSEHLIGFWVQLTDLLQKLVKPSGFTLISEIEEEDENPNEGLRRMIEGENSETQQ